MPKRVALGLVGGALLALCFPPYYVSALSPLAIAVLLVALEGSTRREAAYTGAAFGAVYFGATLFWLGRIFGPGAVPLIAILASFCILFAVLYSWLRERLPRFPHWLLAPVPWTAIEWYRSEPFVLSFGWMGIGYSTGASFVWGRIASWVGSYGITFLIVSLGALVAPVGARNPGRSIRIWALAVAWVCLCGSWLAFEQRRYRTHEDLPTRSLNVRLVQAPGEDEEDLFALSTAPSMHKLDAIVWPEYSLKRDPRFSAPLYKKLEQLAQKQNAVLIVGAERYVNGPGDAYYNTAFVIGPDRKLLGIHAKNHTVHLFQDGIPGTDAKPIDTPRGNLGLAICFDMDYPDVARRLVEGGAEVFLVPNMDPAEWGPVQRAQHRAMFAMRAAECNRWLARADVAGGTSVEPPYATAMRIAVPDGSPTQLEHQIGLISGRTFYVRWGWLLPKLCAVATLMLCMAAVVATITRKHEHAAGDDEEQPEAGSEAL